MEELHTLRCRACRGDEPALSEEEIRSYLELVEDWELDDSKRIPKITKRYSFPDFRSALDFTTQVGEAAEEQDHHPRLTTEWGRVKVTWWTHKIEGLHQNDFIMAAKSDRIYRALQGREAE